MAIDTANKRASAPCLFLFIVPPAPDGAVDAYDRSHLDVYAGIATAELTLTVPEPSGALLAILTADLGIFFDTDDFADTVTYAGAEVEAVVDYGGEEAYWGEENIGKNSALTDARLYVKKSDVPSVSYRDVIVIDGSTWNVRQILLDDDDLVWELRITKEERPII